MSCAKDSKTERLTATVDSWPNDVEHCQAVETVINARNGSRSGRRYARRYDLRLYWCRQLTHRVRRMLHVVSSSAAPGHMYQLREWLIAEWGEVNPFKSQRDGSITVPQPLLGIDGQELRGGLIFSGFRKPGGDSLGLWINALFVAPKHRRKRIASQLIRAAEVEAFRTGERALFALTNIPKLYENLGWQRVESSSDGIVLRAVLADE